MPIAKSGPSLKEKVSAVFKAKTRDEWTQIMQGTDACFAPVLTMDEAKDHPHNKSRDTITSAFGFNQPNVAPRFSGTPSEIQGPPVKAGADNETGLQSWGFSDEEVAALKDAGVF